MAAGSGSSGSQEALWNGPAGQAWVDTQAVLDRMFAPLETLLAAQVPAGSALQVLDIGCGTGATALAAARRLGAGGGCTGIDISEPMVALARARAAREGVPATFVRADAQGHDFGEASFDLFLSRFGIMFFDDPVRAFANLRRAASVDAALYALAWRAPAENPFMTAAERAAAPLLPALPARRPGAPGQFAFADPARVRQILDAAGWAGIGIEPVDIACTLPEAALTGYLTRLGPVGLALHGADAQTRDRVVATVRAAFEPFVQGSEVRFTAACWAIAAGAPTRRS
ncbi:MAG: methyltransferase domain-containing protein [Sneathiellaceae bacterium]